MINKICQIQIRAIEIKTNPIQTLAINPASLILIQGKGRQIQVCYFGGYFKLLRKIQLVCEFLNIVFSKQKNWFASASCNHQVQVWKLLPNGDWIGSQPNSHFALVTCLLFNKDESQLISCSYDKSIIVWQVNYENNKIVQNYKLENKHTYGITSISLNQSETYLVSCATDYKIILWCNIQNKWEHQCEILNDDFGRKIYFFSDFQFAWQQQSQGILRIFEIQNNNIIHRQKQNLYLNKEKDLFSLFPQITNQDKGIIIHKLNKFIFILQNQGGCLKYLKVPIESTFDPIYGALTINGEFLILQTSAICKIYKIQYQ